MFLLEWFESLEMNKFTGKIHRRVEGRREATWMKGRLGLFKSDHVNIGSKCWYVV
jgi:hypothetical protein